MQRLSRWNVGSSITASSHDIISPSPKKSSFEPSCWLRLEVRVCDFPEDAVTQCNVRDTGSRVLGASYLIKGA